VEMLGGECGRQQRRAEGGTFNRRSAAPFLPSKSPFQKG
jgi:hypothetical protein